MSDEEVRGIGGSRAIVTDIAPIVLLIGVMAAVALGVGATTLTLLYRTAFEAQSERLLENVRTATSFLEASAAARQTWRRFDAPGGVDGELLALVQDAHTRYERFAAGADLTLTQRQGNDIVFLLKHTHEEHGKPAKVPFASRLAEPARRALRGQSGTVIGLDFRGVEVLAAYAPVAALGLGVVTKVDLAEVRAPFVRAGGIAGAVAVLMIGLGTLAFLHLTNPMLRRLAQSEARFRGIAGAAQDGVIVMAPTGQVTFWNPAAERIFGYRAEEATGRMVAELIVPARYRARHDAGVERFGQTGEGPMVGHTTEHDALTKAGGEIPIELSLAALRLGDTWHAVATIRDISERKTAERDLQESQSRFALFMDHLPAAVFIKDAQSRVLYVNQYLKTHFGAEESEGRVICQHSLVETSERLVRDDRKALAERELELVETLTDRTGRERTFQTHKFVIPQPEERPALLGGIAWDITDTLAATEALRRSERRYREIFEIAQEGIWLIDAEARTVEVNGRMAQMLGYTVDEMQGRHLFEFMDEEARAEAEALRDRRRKGIKEKYDFRYRAKTGASLWTMVSSAPMHDAQGAFAGALRMVTDITERKRSEDALRSHEQQLSLILASTGEGIFGIDQHGRCLFANRACATLLGYDDEAVLLGKRMHALTHHTRADGRPYPVETCPTYETCRSGKATRVEGELLWRADGSAFPVEYQSQPMRQDGDVVGAVVTFSDMTQRLAAREALRRERDFAESLIETAPVIILVLDPEGHIVRFNPFMAELTGYRLEEVQGKDWFATFLPEGERPRIQAVFQKVISGLPAPRYVNPILTRTAQERLIEWHNKTLKDAQGQVFGCLSIGHDITAEKAREAQLFQAQKMEVIGRLTSSIAHDFNNLLTVILGNLELIEEQLPTDSLLGGFASDARCAAQDGAALTQRLLGFARKTPLQPVWLRPQDFLPQCERLLRRALNEAIRLEVHCEATLAPLCVDRAQLESALLNLVINAHDAMPNGGQVGISANALSVGTEGHPDFPTLRAGDYGLVTVSDTGTGMSAAQLARATEPFYTTKASGKGSGLGLSMVYSFARDSGGALRLKSQPGEGTEVSLALPVAPSPWENEPQPMAPSDLVSGQGTILVVEDEARVRKLAKQYLSAAGYTVLEAESGDAALAMIQSGTLPDLLFSDIALPGTLDGYRLASHIEQAYPDIKVLLTTGAGAEKLAGSGIDVGHFPLLRKPYRATVLAAAVHDLLVPGADCASPNGIDLRHGCSPMGMRN